MRANVSLTPPGGAATTSLIVLGDCDHAPFSDGKSAATSERTANARPKNCRSEIFISFPFEPRLLSAYANSPIDGIPLFCLPLYTDIYGPSDQLGESDRPAAQAA